MSFPNHDDTHNDTLQSIFDGDIEGGNLVKTISNKKSWADDNGLPKDVEEIFDTWDGEPAEVAPKEDPAPAEVAPKEDPAPADSAPADVAPKEDPAPAEVAPKEDPTPAEAAKVENTPAPAEVLVDDTPAPAESGVHKHTLEQYLPGSKKEMMAKMAAFQAARKAADEEEVARYQFIRQYDAISSAIYNRGLEMRELLEELAEFNDLYADVTRGRRSIIYQGKKVQMNFRDMVENFKTMAWVFFFAAQSVDAFPASWPGVVDGVFSVDALLMMTKVYNPDIEAERYSEDITRLDGGVCKAMLLALTKGNEGIGVLEWYIDSGSEGSSSLQSEMTNYSELLERWNNDISASMYWLIWMHFKARAEYAKKMKSGGSSQSRSSFDPARLKLPYSIGRSSLWAQTWARTAVEDRIPLLKGWLEEDRSRFNDREAKFIRGL